MLGQNNIFNISPEPIGVTIQTKCNKLSMIPTKLSLITIAHLFSVPSDRLDKKPTKINETVGQTQLDGSR